MKRVGASLNHCAKIALNYCIITALSCCTKSAKNIGNIATNYYIKNIFSGYIKIALNCIKIVLNV